MKKIKFYPKIFILFFLILSLPGWIFVRGMEYYSIEGIYKDKNFNNCFVNALGYDVNDGTYTPNNSDPQINLKFLEDYSDGVYGFEIYLDEEIDLSNVQVYFGRDSQNYSEGDSIKLLKKNANVAQVISSKKFKFARVDINEEFTIDGFRVAEEVRYVEQTGWESYMYMFLTNLVVSLVVACFSKIKIGIKRILELCKKLLAYVWQNKKIIIKYSIVLLMIFALSYGVEKSYGRIKNQDYFNRYRFVIIYAIQLIIAITIWFRKSILKYMHIYFFIIMMIVGTVHTYVAPRTCGVSYDDEIHYGRTEFFSRFGNGKISEESKKMIAAYAGFALTKNGYSIDGRIHWEASFLDYEGKEILIDTQSYNISEKYVSYIPGVVGLNIGRGLGMDYIDTFMFGKWMNMLCYSLVLAVSVKLMKTRGKLIIIAIGMIPTSLFMASTYTYDWWVIVFTILGYAMFFSDIQQNKKITTKKMWMIMFVMVIAMLPKAVYFPLIFPMMLLNKDKYEDSRKSRWLVVFAMFILIASFILPMLIGTGSTGDVRGGSEVNAMEQIKFILSQPLEYTRILLTFLTNYVSTDNASGYLTMLGYYGTAEFYTICLLVIATTAIIDNNVIVDKVTDSKIFKAGVLLAVFGSLVLVATALYVDFTPVMYQTINGCQPRYILPVIFIVLFGICRIKIDVPKAIKGKCAMVVCVVMSYIYLYGIYDLCIAYY